MKKIKRVACLTSGGDGSGMNPCIRSSVRTAIYNELEVFGFERGYSGLVHDYFRPLKKTDVSGIINKGGTILKTSRCEEFLTREGREEGYGNLKRHKIDALIVMGGNGTYRGAVEFIRDFNFPIVGVPATIDNDIKGTDYTIGYDTAVNNAMEAIDKIRDTASSHERLFIVEVMGRHAGYIALETGIASGAEEILIPETKTSIDEIIENLEKGRLSGKTSSIIVVAEGDEAGGAFKIAEQIKGKTQYETRVSVLGYIQRGGPPTALERKMASRFGYWAVNAVLNGDFGKAVGIKNGRPTLTNLEYAIKKPSKINKDDLKMIRVLSI